jgi:hypothetical protein
MLVSQAKGFLELWLAHEDIAFKEPKYRGAVFACQGIVEDAFVHYLFSPSFRFAT